MLFVPADDVKKQQKALLSNSDAIIFDLEDSVSLDNKIAARAVITQTLTNLKTTKSIVIRINALDTPFWQDDLDTSLDLAPDYILLPKARSGEDVAKVNTIISQHKKAAYITKIIALVTETPESIFNMATFKNSGDKLCAVTWGAEDLSAELGAQNNKDENGVYFPVYQLARSMCLLGASHASVEAIDTVFTNFKDPEGLKKEAIRAKTEGFTGKMLIHPNQIDIVNEAFTPTSDELAHAQQIVDIIDNSTTGGVAQLNGEMLDRPHYLRALNLLKRYK